MNKTEAIEKIKKILALATDRAATPEEKDTALKMANKLADKYGLKIVIPETKPAPQYSTPQQKANPTNFYNFNPKRVYTELIEAFAFILSKSGFPCFTIKEGRKIVGIRYLAARDLTEELERFYKMTIKSCERFKKTIPANSYVSGRAKTIAWKSSFVGVHAGNSSSGHIAQADGQSIIFMLKKLKEELG